MTVGTIDATPQMPSLTPQTADSDLDTKDLDGHFRADLHASARPYYDRLIALAALWARTPTGRQVLADACDLDGAGKRIKFQASTEAPSSPETQASTRTVLLAPHLLETAAKEIGVAPDVDHACELMKDVAKALNVLASRVDKDNAFGDQHMDPEKLASAFRRELQELDAPPKRSAPLLPPPPDPAFLKKLEQRVVNKDAEASPPEAKTQTLRSVASTDAPSDPGEHPYNTTIIEPRTQSGRGRRLLHWMQKRFHHFADSIRSVFGRSHTPIQQAAANVGETANRRPSATSVTTIGRGVDAAANLELTYSLLRRDSREIDVVPVEGQGAPAEAAATGAPADGAAQKESGFARGHRRTRSEIWTQLKNLMPGRKTHQPIPGTRDNSLSEARSHAGSFSEGPQKHSFPESAQARSFSEPAQKRSSVDVQAQSQRAATENASANAVTSA